MKRIILSLSALAILFCVSGDSFAQADVKPKLKRSTRKKSSKTDEPAMPVLVEKPCFEQVSSDPYGTLGNSPPPAPKKIPCRPTTGEVTPLRIFARPQPAYTAKARANLIEGTVALRVTFNADGSIGSVVPISGLAFGLTEQAMAAARSLRFEPKKINGQPITISKQVEYTFKIF